VKKYCAFVVAALLIISLGGCDIFNKAVGLDQTIAIGGTLSLDSTVKGNHGVWVGLLKSAPFSAPSNVSTWYKYQQLTITSGQSTSYSFSSVDPGKYIVVAFYDVNNDAIYNAGEPSGGYPAPNGNPLFNFTEDYSLANVTVAYSGATADDAQSVTDDKAALELVFTGGETATAVTGNLTLPTTGTNGSTISWASTNTAVVSVAGIVVRPTADTVVTLVATVTKGSSSDAKLFSVTVKAGAQLSDADAVAADMATLAIGYSGSDSASGVTSNLSLPAIGAKGSSISWTSGSTTIVSAAGVVTRPEAPTVVILTATIAKGSASATKPFEITVLSAALTDAQSVSSDKGALAVGYAIGDSASGVTSNLTLPTAGPNGSSIAWSSSDATVISPAGVVTRPETQATVTLTATITKGAASDTASFALCILPATLSDAQAVSIDKNALAIGYAAGDSASGVTSNLTLSTSGANGSSIAWSSSDATVISQTGVVTRPAAETSITLTATVAKGSASSVVMFNLLVLPATMTDAQAAAADRDALDIVFAAGDSASGVTQNLTLAVNGTNGSAITWASNYINAITAAGVVTRQSETATVTLTATIVKGSVSYQKTFQLAVTKAEMTDALAVSLDADALGIFFAAGDTADGVTLNVTLAETGANGTSITWASDNSTVVSPAGIVARPATANQSVVLTATVTKGSANQDKAFTLTVLKRNMTDAEAVAADKAALAIGYASGDSATYVTQNLSLPTSGSNGSTISWVSNSWCVVVSGSTGTVTRPVSSGAIKLTATIAKNATSDTQEFYLLIIKSVPLAPESLQATTITATTITLSWQASGADSFQLYRDGSQVYSGADATYTDTGLTPSTTYTYRVCGTNSSGSSPLSQPIAPTTSAAPPAAPTWNPVACTGTSSSFTLSWTAPAGTVTGYKIYYDTTPTGTFTNYYSRPSGVTTLTDTNSSLASGTVLFYKIIAYNGAGNSPPSALITSIDGNTTWSWINYNPQGRNTNYSITYVPGSDYFTFKSGPVWAGNYTLNTGVTPNTLSKSGTTYVWRVDNPGNLYQSAGNYAGSVIVRP
jgi:hypothetical protein